MGNMIGLSFSFCIADIIEGNVEEQDVLFIMGDCKAQNDSEWKDLTEYYSTVYWRENPDLALEIANRLRDEGRIHFTQKRFGINIAHGHWLQKP